MSRPRVAVIVQARMSSVRMPGKVLAPLGGEPALRRMMQRVERMRTADRIVVATSVDPGDDPVAELCSHWGLACVRGPLNDVLARFIGALPTDCEVVVRLTGDCPLIDPAIADRHVEAFVRERSDTDYVTNAVRRTMPDGLDVEVVSREILERAHREATSAFDREHCTPWIRRNGRVRHVTQTIDLSELRWTLDTPRDHEVISTIYEQLDSVDPAFGSTEIYRLLLRHPDLIHVQGQANPTPAERDRWCARIEEHLASPDEATP